MCARIKRNETIWIMPVNAFIIVANKLANDCSPFRTLTSDLHCFEQSGEQVL